jgi:hypothetical protein
VKAILGASTGHFVSAASQDNEHGSSVARGGLALRLQTLILSNTTPCLGTFRAKETEEVS